MSDAQLPPDSGQGEDDPPPAAVAALGDGIAPAAAFPDTDLVADAPQAGTSASTDVAVTRDALELDAVALEYDASTGDSEPAVDLRDPDALAVFPASPEPVALIVADAADPVAFAVPLHNDPSEVCTFETEAVSGDGSAQPQTIDEHPDTPVANATIEISPIFSALDAAEVAAAELGDTEPDRDPADTAIVLSFSRAAFGDDAPLPQQPQRDAVVMLDTDAQIDAAEAEESAGLNEPPPAITDNSADDTSTAAADAATREAAARIAAEASATAAALENLKRLLAQNKLPAFGVTAPPNLHEVNRERTEPPPIPARNTPFQPPIVPPAMVAPPVGTTTLSFADHEEDEFRPRRRLAAAVGSFFAGFALSWVFGAVLYVYLTAG